MKAILKQTKEQRDGFQKKLAELQKNLQKMVQTCASKKAAYDKLKKVADDSRVKFRESEHSASKDKSIKLKGGSDEAARKAEKANNEYIINADELNKARRKHFSEDLRALYDDVQQLEIKRVKEHGERLHDYGDCMQEVHPILNTCIVNIVKQTQAINPAADSQLLVNEYRSGHSIADYVAQFDGDKRKTSVQQVNERRVYKSKFFKTSDRKKAAIREDFGHLPPERRKRAIQEKVDELTASKAKEAKNIIALKKTIHVYKTQPQMGSSKATAKLEQELVESERRSGLLEVEVQKFQLYLEAIATASPGGSSSREATPMHTPAAGSGEQPDFDDNDDGEDFSDGEDFDEEVDAAVDLSTLPRASALYDFPGTNEGELNLVAGQLYFIVEDDDQASGWVQVRDDAGAEGYAPSSYIQKTTSI